MAPSTPLQTLQPTRSLYVSIVASFGLMSILCGHATGFMISPRNQISRLSFERRSRSHYIKVAVLSGSREGSEEMHRKRFQAPKTYTTGAAAAKGKIHMTKRALAARPKSMEAQSSSEVLDSKRAAQKNEIILCRRIKIENTLQECYKLLERRLERPPSPEEWCAVAGFKTTQELMDNLEAGRQAKSQLVSDNFGLVQSVVRKYVKGARSQMQTHGSRVESTDIVQEGVLGLIHAAEKFDADRGIRFSTYATIWVNSYVGRFMKSSRLVHVPFAVQDLGKKIQSVEKEVLPDGKVESFELNELAEAFNVTITKARSARRSYQQSVVSYDAPIDETHNFIEEYSASESEGEQVTAGDIEAVLRNILSSQEISVLRLRFGLDGEASRSYREISTTLGIGREMSRRICQKSFEKLRNTEAARALMDSCRGEYCEAV